MNRIVGSLVVLALVAAGTPALATDRDDQVTLCASALDAQGLAKAEDYRARFVKAKGAVVQTIVVKLIPNAGGESLTAECLIKRGEVTEATIKA
jgi:hypothetical protein